MGTFKKKQYEGKELSVDEEDDIIKTIHFFGNGIIIQFDAENWDDIKKELKEALT